ncbi:MAG: transposase [Alphaproteobacteria bacterium]
MDREYPHTTIVHARGQYVIGAVHTQKIEGFWSLVKHRMIGTFHEVSHKYLPLYVSKFQFRYNNHGDPDIFGEAIKGC